VTYFLIVLISSLIGDSIILVASIQPNGIKLNKFIVTVMQHIAVSDLLSCFTFVLPTIITLIADKWVIGDIYSFASVYIDMVNYGVNTVLITLLSASKLFLLKYPAQIPRWTIRRGHVTCASIWMFGNIFPMIYFFFCFPYLSYGYDLNKLCPERVWIKSVGLIMEAVTELIMTISTVLILFHLSKARRVARRSGGRIPWQGVTTVVTTTTIFCVSVLPSTWVMTIHGAYYSDHVTELTDKLSWVASCCTGLNIMSNIYVYCLTVPSLRRFIVVKVLRGWFVRQHPAVVPGSSVSITK